MTRAQHLLEAKTTIVSWKDAPWPAMCSALNPNRSANQDSSTFLDHSATKDVFDVAVALHSVGGHI